MKKNLIKSTIIAVLALMVILVGAPNALADDFICTTSIFGGTYDNVIVPYGRSCSLNQTTVTGNLKVEENCYFFGWYITVDGNVQADGAERVQLLWSTVHGDVQAKNIWDYFELLGTDVGKNAQVQDSRSRVFFAFSEVGGNLQVEGNYGSIRLVQNDVGGAIQANKNTGPIITTGRIITTGPIIIDNDIGENLQCFDNAPPPAGFGNNAGGNIDGQCSNL